MKHLFLGMAMIAFLFSCKSGDIKSSKEYKDVMAIHDEVMPLVTEFRKVKNEFKNFGTAENLDNIRNVNAKFVEADDAMMKWMSEFKLPENASEAKAYLAAEQTKINEIATKIKEAKTNGENLLTQLKAAQK